MRATTVSQEPLAQAIANYSSKSAAESENDFGFGASKLAMASMVAAPPTPVASEFKTCPDCAEQIRFAARKCCFCRYMFEDVGAEA